MITRVELVNFKSHAQPGNVFDFTGGANAVLGPTGAGKTSILQAIGLCVFDFGQPGHYLRKGAKKGEAIVTFRSPIDKALYTIRRQLGGSKFQLLDAENVVLAETKEDALRTVRAKLGLEPGADLKRLFEELIGTPQGQLTGAFAQTDANRVAIFNRILRIEEYRAAYQALSPVEARARAELGTVQTGIARLEALVEGAPDRRAQLGTLTKEASEANVQLEATVKAQGETGKALESVRAEKKAADDAREQLAVLQRKTASQRTNTQGLKRRVDEAVAAQKWLDANKVELAKARDAQKYLDEHEASYVEYQEAVRARDEAKRHRERRHAEVSTWNQRREEKSGALAKAPDFAALARKFATLTRAEERAGGAHEAAAAAVEAARGRLADLPRVKKTWTGLEAIRVAAERVPGEYRNGGHRAQLDQGRLHVHQIATLQESLDGQFQSLASKACPLLDVACPVSNVNLSKAHAQKRKQLVAQLNEAEGGLLQLERNAAQEEESARKLQAWEDRKGEHADAARLLKELGKLNQGLPDLRQKATQKRSEWLDAQKAVQTCQRDLAQRERFDALKEDVQQLAKDIATAEKEIKQLDTTLTKTSAMASKLAPMAKTYEAHHATRKRLSGLVEQAGPKVALSGERAARTQEWEEATGTLKALEGEEAKDGKRVAELWTPKHEERLARAEKGDKDAHARVAQLRQALEDLSRRSTELQARVAQDGENQAKLDEARADLAEAEATRAHIETIRRILNDAGPVIAKHFVAAISVVANQKYQDLTGGQPARLRWTETYDVEVTDSDGETKTFRDLSGGEQVMAALAVRLALLAETSGLPFAFFDEPTIHLDEDARNHVAEVLNRTGFDQLIVVSHDDSFSEKIHHAVRLRKVGTRTEQVRPLHTPGGDA